MDYALCEERTTRRCRVPVNKILPQPQFADCSGGKFASEYFKADSGNIRQCGAATGTRKDTKKHTGSESAGTGVIEGHGRRTGAYRDRTETRRGSLA
jgi:hypothetical protein